jgi:uncharacterized protein (DUF305 family)
MKSMRIAFVAVAACAIGLASACTSPDHHAATTSSAAGTEQADHNADDIAFAQSMVPHHEQAIEMAQMVPTNTENQQLVGLANQVISTQVPEVQALRVWLMQWQDASGHDPATHEGAPMAGMVSEATMDKLRTLHGADFDRLWLMSMIDHHRGAIAMAQQEVARGKNPDVIYLAKSIVTAQQAEIDQMNRMLGG